MANTTPSPEAMPLDLLVDRAQHAETALRDAQSAFERAQHAARVWSSLRDAVQSRYYARIVQIFTQDAALFSTLRKANDPAIPVLEQLYKMAQEHLEEVSRDFANLFDSACRSQEISLDSASRHPRYSIGGFIQIVVDDRKQEARLSTRDGPTEDIPLDPLVLAHAAKRHSARIFERSLDTKRFLIGLRKAYRAVVKEEKRKLGDEIPLRRVANRLAKNWKSLMMDEFNVDLARVVKGGELTVDGERMHLNHTRDTRQGMLLNGLENGGYVGFISFKKEGSHA